MKLEWPCNIFAPNEKFAEVRENHNNTRASTKWTKLKFHWSTNIFFKLNKMIFDTTASKNCLGTQNVNQQTALKNKRLDEAGSRQHKRAPPTVTRHIPAMLEERRFSCAFFQANPAEERTKQHQLEFCYN